MRQMRKTQSGGDNMIGQQAGDDANKMAADNLSGRILSLASSYEHKRGWAQAWKNERQPGKPGDQRRDGKEESYAQAILKYPRHEITGFEMLRRPCINNN